MTDQDLTARQAELVAQSYRVIQEAGDLFPDRLYAHLFTFDPAARELFLRDPERQRQMLVVELTTVARAATNLERMRPQLEALGKRHHDYGVKRPHFTAFKFAFMKALAETMGEAYDPDMTDAWNHFYDAVARIMTGEG